MKRPLLTLLLASATILCHAQINQSVGSVDPNNAQSSRTLQSSNPNSMRVGDPVVAPQAIFPNTGWTNKEPLAAGRWATGPVFVNPCIASANPGYIFLIGGGDAAFANTTLNTRYDVQNGTYSAMAALPLSRLQISPVEVNGKIYVMGGYSTSFTGTNTNQIYDIATNTWSTGAPLLQSTGDYAIGVYKDSLIYVACGYNAGDLTAVQVYNTFTNTWAMGSVFTGTAVAGCRMGIVGNEIVFVGGYNQTLGQQSAAYLGTINTATPTTITWTALPAYPGGPAGRHASGVPLESNGLVYFAGGDPDGAGTLTLNTCYAYNTVTDVWDSGPNMPVSVSNICNLAGAVRNDSLFMVTMGGWNGSAVTTTHSWLGIGTSTPPTASTDVTICAGATTQLNAFNALSYVWSPAGTLNNANIANPVATPTGTTTYTVSMNRGWGCPVTDQVVVTVNPMPTVTANTTATAVCTGTQVTLSGGGAVSYVWTGGVTDAVPFTPVSTNTYTVTGSDAIGCSATATVTVTVNSLPTVTANTTASAVCNGSPVTLTGGGATSYVWTGGVTDNVAFNPTVTDTYTVTGTDGNGCSNTATVSVTVNSLPTVTANTTASAICNGSPVTLTGGGAASYVWTGGVTDNVAFNPTVTDTYTVTGTDGNGCSNTATVSVMVNSLPTVTANTTASAVCNGSPVTLTGSGAASYVWTGGVTDNVAFNPTVTDTYTVTGTDGNGCSNTATVSVTVNSLPTVTANTTASAICEGSPVTLTGGGATSYVWTGGATDNVAFNPTVTDTYTVTGTDGNGCSNTATVTVVVNTNPTVTVSFSMDTACTTAGNITLAGESPVGGTWSGPGVSGNTFDPVAAGVGTAVITYLYTDGNGCSGTAMDSVVVDLCLGLTENQQVSVSVYPNPNTGVFTINTASGTTVEITDALGRVVSAFVTTHSMTEVNISSFDNGVYLIRTINGEAVTVTRVVKQ